jgi:hypothetical protein
MKCMEAKVKLVLRQTASRSLSLGISQPSGTHENIYIPVGLLWVCWCGAPSRRRGRACSLQSLLGLAYSAVLAPSSRKTHDEILFRIPFSIIENFRVICLVRGGHSVDIVRSRTKGHEAFVCVLLDRNWIYITEASLLLSFCLILNPQDDSRLIPVSN